MQISNEWSVPLTKIKKYALKKKIALESSTTEDGYVVIDTHNAAMFSCNESAWILFEQLGSAATIEALSAHIEQRFAVGREAAARDVTEFLRQLSAAGLIDETA